MSSVIRPSGPLPRRVYWVRRLLVLVIAVVVITLLWWVMGRLTGSADESKQPSGGSPLAAPTTGDETGSGDDEPVKERHRKPANHHRQRPAAPTGDCDPAEVGVRVVADDATSGVANPVKLKLTSLVEPACTLSIAPSTLALRITSGDDVIWSSDDCPDELAASQLVVRKSPAATYEFDWNGHRSTESCTSPGGAAKAGGYWAEAALIGADSHRAYFDIS